MTDVLTKRRNLKIGTYKRRILCNHEGREKSNVPTSYELSKTASKSSNASRGVRQMLLYSLQEDPSSPDLGLFPLEL
jgi:hypothetical protein